MLRLTFYRRVFTALFLLNFLLSGCDCKTSASEQEPPKTVAEEAKPSPTAEDKQVHLSGTPQKACGDVLPKNSNAYPVNLYPVFVSYSEKNLELVKQHFCEDAFKKALEQTGKDAIQVASFTSQERANRFKEKLSNYFSGADIGNPTFIRETPDAKVLPILTQDQVIHKAKLTPEQVKRLVSVLGISKDFEKNNVIVLPTDVPTNYTVDELIVWRGETRVNSKMMIGYYEIVYKNPYGACFLVGGGEKSPRGEGLETYEKISNIQTSALGSVELALKGSAKKDGTQSIEFTAPTFIPVRGRNEYRFESPFGGYFLHGSYADSDKLHQKFKNCKMMNLQDAKRVVQSLQFIDP